ncbi:energy transducer TonB [Hymenobacter cheonanensis]|uniref:energy transducer TonB n=1 Tax=Hymenobacter sp. CA2-7 TaxID=3063993 RepID=UPI0027125748|nr:energy transducer TonB [Hymenobacter sp. CA2-7]MDO7887151.1 energy transducer TonB [Hymenobacter sp. CA2-7]
MARAAPPARAGRRLALSGLLLGLCLWPLASRVSEIDHILAGAATLLYWLVGLAAGVAALVVLVVVVATPAAERRTGPAWLAGLALISLLCLGRAGLFEVLRAGWAGGEDEARPFGLVLPARQPAPSPGLLAEIARVNSADTARPSPIYTYVAAMPHLPGGDSTASQRVRQLLQYPAAARLHGARGLVYLSFLVGTRGEVLNPHVVKSLGYGCDEEARRVLAALPPFVPGIQNGRPVVVQLLWAFSFRPRPQSAAAPVRRP